MQIWVVLLHQIEHQNQIIFRQWLHFALTSSIILEAIAWYARSTDQNPKKKGEKVHPQFGYQVM
jgi:hypothetical protein